MNKLLITIVVAIVFSLPTHAKNGDKEDGYGAGGLRDDYSNESGLEHGKSWAGNKEVDDVEKDQSKEYKHQKQKTKQKKERKQKRKNK
ncbi:MAG: hypothetical protein GQ475_04730 [Methylococcaceae bacterium]|nr:hypothetical protein [Methylococcaceae bacterium]